MRGILWPIVIVALCVATYRVFKRIVTLEREVKRLQDRCEQLGRQLQDAQNGR